MMKKKRSGGSAGKSRVAKELDQLREQGLASIQSVKLNKSETSSFLTPEEAQAYLNTSTRDRRATIQNSISSAPSNLSTVGMNNWYNEQKMRYLEEKKKRKEAQQFLKGYRQSYTEETSVSSGTTATSMSTYDTNTKDLAEVGVLDKRIYKEMPPQCSSSSGDNFAKEMTVQQTIEPEDGSTAANEIGVVEKVEKSDMEPIEQQPCGDGAVDKTAELDCTAAKSHKVDGHDIIETFDTGLVEQRLDIDDNSEKPASTMDSNIDRADESGENDSKVPIAGDNMEENTSEKEVEQAIIPVDPDEEVVTTVLPSVSEIASRDIVNDGMIENADKINDQINPQSCDGEEGDDAGNDNVTLESQEKSPNLTEEEDGQEEIHQTPNEDGQEEVTEQVQSDTVPKDNANVSCSADVEHCSRNELNTAFQAEASRYHLYISHACPFAHRAAIVVALKGLQEIIGITHVHPTWQYTKPGTDEHRGWVFGSPDGRPLSNTNGYGSFPSSWGQEDPHNQSLSIRELYEKDNDTRRQYTVPVLWDTKLKTIVSNNSTDIMRIINSKFNKFAKNPELDLYPEDTREVIDNVNSWVYSSLNDGVYNCGLAESQGAYEAAIDDVTDAFDKVELILKEQRYITGGKVTEADIRLFVTLLQFDEIYSVYFKANTRSVSLCPVILKYVRRIYQLDGVKETCDMDMIKAHYYTSHVELNKFSIIPRGEDFMELLQSSRSTR
mmetsp:Transcript_20129/g.24053  ORF Transcript_20129/g.24053 Transcript_20129/m.24053 type:complete len:722 (+) Transcript_20129:76-2241(+)